VPTRSPISYLTELAVAVAGGLLILAGPRLILLLTRRPTPA
jgi:hypothetical protein